MNFNSHSKFEGEHAFLSGSKYHWINYDEEKLDEVFHKYLAIQRGTELHALAKRCIDLGVKLPKSKSSLNQYVNDCIGFRMTTEQILFYSPNAFGTADAISFRANTLRIHDLKTGVTPVSPHQLEVYAALFCLEYVYKPVNIHMNLRVYQNGEILIHEPDPEDIQIIMNKIIVFDKQIQRIINPEEE